MTSDDGPAMVPTPAGVPTDWEPPSVVEPADDPNLERDPAYLRLLLILLVSAAFFEGYDSSILALLLPNIQSTFGVSETVLGITRIPIELGLAVAFFVARLSDRLGRRPMLLWSVVGYTFFTALTAASWNIWSFAFFQFGARVFLGAEYAIGVTMIVEEFPTERRARALGILLAFVALGTIAVGILLGLGLQDTALEWRAFYLVGLFPLVVLSVYRRRIQETRRFELVKAGRLTNERPSMLEPWRSVHRRKLLIVGFVHMFRSIPLFGSTAWWAFYAERERGFTSGEVAFFIICAYGLGCLGYYVCGRAMERFGRRPTGLVYAVGAIVFAITLFQATSKPVSFVALLLAVFFGLGMGPVMGAFATELFPTEMRGQAMAWIRNVFEIAGYVFGPALIGILGDHKSGAIGNIGDTVTALMLLQLPMLWFVWRYLPETKGRDLDEIPA
ncbi:MAG: MFS transporter [Actinomycetota bacterium]|nr:MFS transporter [Actinomycetota bacterium]